MNFTINKLTLFKGMSKDGRIYYSFSDSNYKDKSDKFTWYVNFSNKIIEPMFEKGTTKNGDIYEYVKLANVGCSTNVYKGKPSITIFSYDLTYDLENENNENFGGEKQKLGEEIGLETDDLPFY